MKSILITLMVLALCSCSAKISQPEYSFKNDELEIYKGCFPHSTPYSTENSVLVDVLVKNKSIGTIETRNKKLNLVFVSNDKTETVIWSYADYGCVDKITVNEKENILKVYFDRTLIREYYFVTILLLDTFKTKEILLKRGKWRI